MNRLFTKKSNLKADAARSVPSLLFLVFLLTVAPWSTFAEEPGDQEPSETGTKALSSGPLGLPSAAEPDTIRTNIWLTEAIMAEIVASTARVLPSPPAAVQLVQEMSSKENELFKSASVRVLGGLGYGIYLEDEDPARQAAVDCIYSFSVHGVELVYPEVGRTLGLWRRWVDREMKVTVQVDVVMANSGRILLSERIQRQFNDRVSADQFEMVDSDLYAFTTAETSESGWKSRMEEIIVLGTLAGLVAVYFSNTGD